MPDRVITAEALITAKDGTGDVFTRIASKFQALGKGAKVTPEIEKMVGALERAQSQLRALEKTEGARAKFADARARFQAQKAAVEAAAKAMASAAKPTRELETAYTRAQSAVSKAAAEFERSKSAFLDAKHAAEQFGAPLAKIASEQERLKSVIQGTTQAIERQGAAELRAAEDAKKAASAHAALERAQEKRAHGIAHHGVMNYALSGAAMAVSAHSIAGVVEGAVESGAELQHERVASANAGRTPAEIAAYEDAAKRAAIAVPTASYTESMKTLLETTSAFGSVEHAIDHLNFMMKTAAVLKAASGGKITDSAGEMGQKFAKFFEMRGVANDPVRFEKEGQEMVRAMAFTGGTFNPHEMFNFASQAKSALRNYDANYLSRVVPSLAGENGGERAGTGANAFYNVIMGKARDAKQAKKWMELGLLDPKMVEMKKGQAVSWSAGAVKNTDVALRNPLEWFEKTVLPAMAAKGVKIDSTMELSKVLATMFRNSMSNMFANENAQLADRTRLHKDWGLIDKTETPDAMYQRNLSEDPTQAVNALTASLDSLKAAVTSPAMNSAAGIITQLSYGLTQLSSAAMNHPVAAMTAGGAAGAAALGGAGYMSYQLFNGFGLGASATALDGSAAALTEAAAALGAAGAGKGLAAGAAGGLAEAGAAAGGGALATAAGVTLPLTAAGLLGWYMAKHRFGTFDAAKFDDTPQNRKATQNIGALPGLDDDDEAPSNSAAQRRSYLGWLHKAASRWHPAAAANPYGGLGGAKASFEPHPALGTPHPALAPQAPTPASPFGGLKGPITAVVDKPIDVTGKVTAEVKGQANVTVAVKVIGPGEVTGQYATSSGNIKVSTGASMPGAKTAAAGSTGTK